MFFFLELDVSDGISTDSRANPDETSESLNTSNRKG